VKRLFIVAAMLALLASCGHAKPLALDTFKLHQQDYQWHKSTMWIRAHWNYKYPDKETVVAEGFVEPFDPHNGVHDVALELVGIDDDGNVVNSASGRPSDNYIISPLDKSPFKISMKLNGKETGYTIRGSYYRYTAGSQPNYNSASYDTIPLKSDEPL